MPVCFKIIELDGQRELIGIIIKIDKAIIEKESGVAFFPIRVKDLVTTLDVFKCFDDKAFPIISVGPSSLSWSLMIEHIGIRDKSISFNSFDFDSKDSATHHHADFTILL